MRGRKKQSISPFAPSPTAIRRRHSPGASPMPSLAPLAALAAALLLSGCNPTHEAAREAPPRPVLVVEAHYAPREQAQVLSGVVKARTESDLAFRIAGKMAARLVDT